MLISIRNLQMLINAAVVVAIKREYISVKVESTVKLSGLSNNSN